MSGIVTLTAAGAIDTFLVLLIGIGPKIALVPFLEITASPRPAAKQRVLRKINNMIIGGAGPRWDLPLPERGRHAGDCPVTGRFGPNADFH